jgi:hypothetical protein
MTTVGLATGGLDVEVRGNSVQGGNLTAGNGSGALIADYAGLEAYLAYIGNITFRSNTIACRADGNSCMRLTTRDPVITNNRITATGTACGIKIEGLSDNFVLTDNVINVGAGPALILNVGTLQGLMSGNLLSGAGSHAVYLHGSQSPTVVEQISSRNRISGFRQPMLMIPTRRPAQPPR